MNKKDLAKMFPYLTKSLIDYYVRTNEYKTERGFLSFLQKKNESYRIRAEKKDVKHLKIVIDWKRSKMWGGNPHASYWVDFADGTRDYGSGYTCGGCGYDKCSTVVAEIFNDVVCGMLYRRRKTRKAVPYGVYIGKDSFPSFDGGIGMNCYEYGIAEFLGGKGRHVAWSDTFDQYEFDFKVRKPKSA